MKAVFGSASEAAARVHPLGHGYGRDFWAVFAATFALNGASNMLVLFPLFVIRLGGGPKMIGAIAAFGSAMALMVRPGVPRVLARAGHKSTVFWMLLVEAIALALYAPLHSIGVPIFAVRGIHGAAEGTMRVALFSMLFSLLPEGRHGEAMTIFSLNGMMPAAFAPMLGEEIIRHFGFTAFFATAVAMCLIGAGAMTMVSKDVESRRESSSAALTAAPKLRALIFDRKLLPVWIATLLFSATVVSRINFVTPLASQRHVAQVGWYFVTYSAAAIAVRLSCGRLIDRIGIERVLAPSLFALGVGIALISRTGRPGTLELAGVIGGLGHGLSYPALSVLVIRRTHGAATGRTSAIYTSLFDIAAMIAPYVFGVIASRIGYGSMFLVAGSCALAAGAYVVIAEPAVLRRHLAGDAPAGPSQ
ncbi:MAG: MFS transporter [Candidatus Binataceae bacterium]|nr:MFS transporter [Candidatus Binataceae bacterium]